MRISTHTMLPAAIASACLLCCSIAVAKKPVNPPGGDGGGEVIALYDVLEVPLDEPGFMSDPDSGIITVTGANNTGTGYPAAFVRVRVSDRAVIGSGFLPEPDLAGDVYSQTFAVNKIGTIVGNAGVKATTPKIQRPVAWDFDGTQYQLDMLPMFSPEDSTANGINNLGEIVGTSDGQAVYWDPIERQIYDLNTSETIAQGWHLTDARDINDAGQIVGYGTLDGQTVRGFLLDTDGKVFAAPLLATENTNIATQIDAFGRCLGWTVNPDTYQRAYSWDGPGTNVVELPSVTNSGSIPEGMNDLGEVAGSSYIPGVEDWVATLWAIDVLGQVSTTDLNTVVDSKWTLLRGTDCNNAGWLVVDGKRSYRGGYRWNALLLIPRP